MVRVTAENSSMLPVASGPQPPDASPVSRTLATPHAVLSYYKVVAIGASTGGSEALKELLRPLPADFPGIVMVQHMPEAFTGAFAKQFDNLCRIHVQEARDGDRILPGHALLAPGGHQVAVVRRGAEYAVRVYRGERVNRPSLGRCPLQLLRPAAGEQCARRFAHRHGQRRRAGHAAHERGPELYHCPG